MLRPVGDNRRYDVVIENGGQFYRVQCKTARWRDARLRKVYLVPADSCGTAQVVLRLAPSRNGQMVGTRLAAAFEVRPP